MLLEKWLEESDTIFKELEETAKKQQEVIKGLIMGEIKKEIEIKKEMNKRRNN